MSRLTTAPRPTIGRTLLLTAFTLVWLAPLFWMVVRSLSTTGMDGLSSPSSLSFEQYRLVLFNSGFPRYIANSVLVLLIVVGGNLVSAVLTGYAFARYRFPWRDQLFGLILLTLMLPKQIIAVPILDVMVRLGLHDTLWALSLPFCVDGFNIFLMRQYLRRMPTELEDAARIDGATEPAILRHVIVPICRPALALIIINTAIVNWNAFFFPLVLTDSAAMRTLPVGLAVLTQGPHATDWGALMAGATISSVPMILLFLLFQREIIEGLTAGALSDQD